MEELFHKLRRIEEQLDKNTLKRYLEFEEQHNTRLKCLKRLRIFLKLNIIDNNIHLRIDGRVINDYKNIVETRMSELLKRVLVVFNVNTETFSNVIYLDNINSAADCENTIRTSSGSLKEKIEVFEECEKIKKNENVFEWINSGKKIDSFEVCDSVIPETIKIIFEFDNSKDLVRLSEPLRNLLQTDTITKTKALIEIWKYIRIKNLVDLSGQVTCDEALKSVFKTDHVHLDNIKSMIYQHFLPLEIFSFDIPVRHYERIFDINIERDDLTDFPAIFKDRNINILEKKIQNTIESIGLVNDKKEILNQFANNPVKFMNKLLLVENSDLDFLCAKNSEGLFNDPKMRELIYDMIKNLN